MRKKKTETVVLEGKDGVDPNLLLLDGRDVRAVSRKERRSHGFRGPVFVAPAPTLSRYVRRNGSDFEATGGLNRRQRKARARITRFVTARGLV